MNKYRKEIRISIATLTAIGLLFWGINYLKGKDIFNSDNTYFAVYNTVSGLHTSNYIFINGMKVGYVKKINRMDSQGQAFLVEVAIDDDIKIPNDSKLVMYSAGLLGGTELRVEMGVSPTFLKSKDTIVSTIQGGIMEQLGGDLKPTIEGITTAIARLDSILIAVNKVLDQNGQENIKQSLENIKTTTAYLSSVTIKIDGLMGKEKEKIEKILTNLEQVTSTFSNNGDKFANIIQNFSDISDTLAQAKIGSILKETNQSLSSISDIFQKIDRGEGNVGLLLNDDKLYRNLDSSVKNLDILINDIKQNPKRYLKFSVF